MRFPLAVATGLVFGIALSGMMDPAKVLNFFDIAGAWGPSLVFVMGVRCPSPYRDGGCPCGWLGGRIGIGAQIMVVQDTFGKMLNEGTEFQRDGSQFDLLFEDGDRYMPVFAIHTPGHTPACMVHVTGDAAFVGDTLFMPDGGSASADFPGGDAGALFDSIQRVLTLPDEMRLFMCHDYGPNGRDIQRQTTVAEEKAHSIHVGNGRTPRGIRPLPGRA